MRRMHTHKHIHTYMKVVQAANVLLVPSKYFFANFVLGIPPPWWLLQIQAGNISHVHGGDSCVLVVVVTPGASK
jgi:hypothetical protein